MHRATATALALLAFGCAADPLADAVEETGVDGPFEEVPEEGKYDGTAVNGPRISAGAATEVWAVRHAWSDVTTEAGVAWAANSGLTFEQKFERWISTMATEARHQGGGQTFVMRTPHGDRSFHAPTLECAEVAYFLRAAFASWYGLPFFITGWDATGRQTMYAGHFGFVNASGARVGNFPSFRTAYRDHTSTWRAGQAWPSDSRLRGLRLGTDDTVHFLSTGGASVGAGAYFDEVFLNKRVGYFLRLLLLYFGSANLADGANMFHVRPEAVRPGDVLVHRWQRRGIGHVMPIFRVTRHSAEALEVAIASGSMPRREPVWEDPNTARGRFTTSYAGGPGETSDGDAYAALGGGVRRWRAPRLVSGRWRNEVLEADRAAFIADSDRDAIAARPARFDQLLRSLSTAERREVALAQIEAAREHLRNYPASCAARGRREDAFEALYGVVGGDRASFDATYRTLEDYVLAALVYEQSRTCCWNRTTRAMHGVIMDYARLEQERADRDGMCVAPTVFRAETDGYARWAAHAATMGVEWRAWSEDEACSQRSVPEDTVDAARGGAAWCTLGAPSTPPPPPAAGAGCDATGGGSRATATRLGLASARNAEVCGGEEDWYRVESTGRVTVRIDFAHADGDLDLEAVSDGGAVLASSAGVQNQETVTATGPFFVRVFGYRGAANTYTIIAQ
ncbi:MAG: PPC domain-containing protein [Sandaracinaceae bacterium]|nr:PPC domain-containing protein [Sandaracinaceae bacterium]